MVPVAPPRALGARRPGRRGPLPAHPRRRLRHGPQHGRVRPPRTRRGRRPEPAGGRVLPSPRPARRAPGGDRGAALRGRALRPGPRHRRDRAPRGRGTGARGAAPGDRGRGPPDRHRAGLQLAVEQPRHVVAPLPPLHAPPAGRARARPRLGAGGRDLLLQLAAAARGRRAHVPAPARGAGANGNGNGKSDLHLSPSALDRWLEMPVRAEARLIRRGASLPAGVSVGAVCMRR